MKKLKAKTVNLFNTKNIIKNMDRHKLVFTIYCVFLFAVTAYWAFDLGICYFNSDTASMSVYVREQIQERAFFPKGWNNGGEFNIITPHILILPLSLLHIPAYLCRQITDIVFMAILLFSVIYITKNIFDHTTSMISNIFIFSGISYTYILFLYAQASYACIFFIAFYVLGLFFETVNESLHIQNKRKFGLFLFMVAFVSLNGYRYFEILTIPLILALLTYIFFEDYLENSSSLLLLKNAKNIILFMGLCMSIGYSGYLFLCNHYYVTNNIFNITNYAPLENILGNAEKIFKTFLFIGGYQGDAAPPLLSLAGITGMIKICMHLLFAIFFPYLLAKKYKILPNKIKLFLWFCAWNWILIIVICVFTSFLSGYTVYNCDRYFMFQTILSYMLGAYYVSTYCLETKRKVVTLFSTCCILVFSSLSVLQMYTVYSSKDSARLQWESCNSLFSVLKENDLKFGYSTFWNSHKYTVLSNFEIEFAPISLSASETQKGSAPFPTLSASRVFEKDYYTGYTFLMLSEAENAEYIGENIPSGVIKTIQHDGCIIYVFNYNFGGEMIF